MSQETWNTRTDADPSSQYFHLLVEAQARSKPDAVAVQFEDATLSYRDLDRRANQLARYLRRQGVGPDVNVCLCVERSLDMVIGLLGILKAGGAYVPLDPTYPVDRLEFMARDSESTVLVSQATLMDQLPLQRAFKHLVSLDQDVKAIAQEETDPVASDVAPEQRVYLIYTSGSTGQPKGVEVTHGSLSVYLQTLRRPLGLQASDVFLQTGAFSFSASVRQIMAPLSVGAHVVIANFEQRTSPAAFFTLSKRLPITVWDIMPTFWQHGISALRLLEASARAELLKNQVRLIIVTSERLDWSLPAAWREEFHHPATVVHLYSQTETAGSVTWYLIEGAATQRSGTVPLGRAMDYTQLYVLNQFKQQVPAGELGEIYVGGDRLARGYWKRPELTAEKFIRDPFRPQEDARLYRTGDIGRYRADGVLEAVGRSDQRLKIRGFTVEPSEIESWLQQHSAIKQGVADVRDAGDGQAQLVAYLVPHTPAHATREVIRDLQRLLKSKLPSYMVPSRFFFLEALPLTPNGKVDRQRLRAMGGAPLNPVSEGIAPRTPLEKTIAEAWRDVLGAEVGITDQFFDTGGDSLRAAQVIARLQDALGVEIPLRAFYEAPTIAGLAASISAAQSVDPARRLPSIQPVPRNGKLLPVSYQEQQLWLLEQFQPVQRATYHLATAVRLRGALNLDALAQALSDLTLRHEILRATYVSQGGRPVRRIAAHGSVPLRVTSGETVRLEEQETYLQQQLQAEVQQPFDLQRGPLFRIRLIQQGEASHLLIWTMHHIIADGWSKGLLLQELSTLYNARSSGQPIQLAPITLQYADYAHWQRAICEGPRLSAHLAYWTERLRDLPPLLVLPANHPRPQQQTFRGAFLPIHIPLPLTDALTSLGQQEGASLFVVLLAAWQVLLARYSGQDDVVVGSPVANRLRPELEALAGFFANMLVLRSDLSGNPSFQECLRRARDATFAAHEHQLVPFERLVEHLQPQRSLQFQPLIQVAFAFQRDPLIHLSLPGIEVEAIAVDPGTARFDLTLVLNEGTNGLQGGIEYSTDLFEATTIQRMQDHLLQLLEAIVSEPGVPIANIPLLSPAERQRVIVEWNATSEPVPSATIPELFDAQVTRTPDATALVYENTRLSYATLSRRANYIAQLLQRLRVGPEVLVGLCVERSPDLIIGLLGILKAGGAYLPLDPAYPAERLAWLLEEACCPVLLTQRLLLGQLPIGSREVVCLDDPALVGLESAEPPHTTLQPEHLAYVIYTSGSTGRPKGVQVPHQGVPNLVQAQTRAWGIRPGSRVLQFASANFDASISEICTALLSGATLHLIRQEDVQSPLAVAQVLREQAITVATLPPSLLAAFPDEEFPALETLVTAGEACPAALALRWARRVRFFNAYGPTEATVCATMAQCSPDEPGPPPIGRPISNTECYVLDTSLQPVPIGCPGELYLGGIGLARGYLNRPELTAERFIPHPFCAEEGARLYRTGDLVRYRSDGQLEYLGRLDQQIKLRGYRIEPGEIEVLLGQHPAVQEAYVQPYEFAPGDVRLVAYLICRGDCPGRKELRQFLQQWLPEFMIPSNFIPLNQFPLTPNGKINRNALPSPRQAHVEREAYVAPRTSLEQRMVALWAEVLQVERVGLEDDFFALGGHSLLAVQLLARLQQAFQVDVPLRTLFEAPTVAGLLEAMLRLQMAQADEATLAQVLAEARQLS